MSLPGKHQILAWMVLPLRRYGQFRGRSGRREFWFYSLFLLSGYLAIFAAGVAVAIVSDDEIAIGATIAGGWGLFFVANFVPGLALSVRRLHDLDLSGTLLIAFLLAMLFLNILGWIAYMIVMSLPSRAAPNRHGPPAGDEKVAEVFA